MFSLTARAKRWLVDTNEEVEVRSRNTADVRAMQASNKLGQHHRGRHEAALWRRHRPAQQPSLSGSTKAGEKNRSWRTSN